MSEQNEVVVGVRANFGEVTGELRETEYILYRITSLLNRAGLPPEVRAMIREFQLGIAAIRAFHASLRQLESDTPYGTILGLINLASSAIFAGTALTNATPLYDDLHGRGE